jgi:hypothetical protein
MVRAAGIIRVPGGEDPPAVTLQVTILHPDGNGPFPLAIMNHGTTSVSKISLTIK